VVVGASLGTGSDDELAHRVQVVEHVARGNAHHAKSLTSEQRVASRIALRPIA
jgi:hypothetical protein